MFLLPEKVPKKLGNTVLEHLECKEIGQLNEKGKV